MLEGKNERVYIAGSNAPTEHCYSSQRTLGRGDIIENHRLHISSLLQNGCDLILNETIGMLDEVEILAQLSEELSIQDKSMISFFVDDKGTILSG